MMTEPQAGRLIARICDSLEKTALADMSTPYAQRQLKAALWTLRHVSAGIDTQAARVQLDIADMERTLSALGAAAAPRPLGQTDLQRHVQLQQCVAQLEADAGAPEADALRAAATFAALGRLHRDILAREHGAWRAGTAGGPDGG